MFHARRPISVIAATAVALLVAGCASQGGASNPPPSAPSSAGPEASGAVHSVELHQDASLGAFLTGEDGRTLYLFTRDAAGTSTCTAACASAWPPFILEAGETVTAGSGVTGTLGTVERPDGTDQVAINGLPLYYFAGDDGPAQTNGQGVNDVWFLAAPDGSLVGAGGADTPAPSADDPKYDY